jgi:hypothetical protein
MDLRKIGIDGANWIRLAQDRVLWRAFVNTVMNLRVPERQQDFLTISVTIRFSNNVLHYGVWSTIYIAAEIQKLGPPVAC